MSDLAVEALRRLVSNTEGGRQAVAAALHANEQTLYQILSGVPLKSGKPRTVGRDLRERLERVYPGWLSHDSSINQQTSSPVRIKSHTSELGDALVYLGIILKKLPIERREAVSGLFSSWVKEGGSDIYHGMIKSLLEQEQDLQKNPATRRAA